MGAHSTFSIRNQQVLPMVAGYKTTSIQAASFTDNLCRWDGRSAPHYEVWFLTLNHRASQRGFWFRYTIESPTVSSNKPTAAVWAAAFERARPDQNFGLKCEHAIDCFALDKEGPFGLKIADARLEQSRASGCVEDDAHRIAWDLSFTPNEKSYHHITRALVGVTRPSSFVCSPNLDARFSGTIEVDGREMILEDEPGCQSHLWGRKHVDEWVWVHSNAFESHTGTVFEGLAARPRRMGKTLPPIYSLMLRHRGEEHRFIRLRFAEQWKRHLGMGYWSFSAMNTRLYIEGVAQCRLRDMIQARYCDPDGEPLYCINSEVANLKIRLFRRVHAIRWRHVETIQSRATAHLEHASRNMDSSVKMAFD
ncbi:MAG TPA: tocopherol cyclase family protein [Blastocatellia bacterium]|nr:tocopherol cyclase family protein [Blastocatellia bacterium]